MSEQWELVTEQDPPYQAEDEYVLLEVDPGDVIFFDCYVPQGSPVNNSSRRNIFLTFNRPSNSNMRHKYYADKWAF